MSDPFYEGLPDPDAPASVDELSAQLAGSLEGRRAEPGEQIEPVYLTIERTCRFKAKECGLCGKPKSNKLHRKKNVEEGLPFCKFKRQNGCVHCGKAKNAPDHLGAPESFNIFASGDWTSYQSAKQRWHVVLDPLLRASGLPFGLARVLVEGECSFGDAAERDQGNHRVVIEKALGDVLQAGGWIEKDKWHVYEFGNLSLKEEGVNRLRLTIFAFAPEPEGEPAQASLL